MEGKTGVALAPSQREALALALRAKVLVITGGPGVGKTTLVNAILRVLRAKRVEVAQSAPTGRAAKRLAESTGLEARTIHRLLEADPKTGGFKRGDVHPLDCDLLVVDECRMVDVPLMRVTFSDKWRGFFSATWRTAAAPAPGTRSAATPRTAKRGC